MKRSDVLRPRVGLKILQNHLLNREPRFRSRWRLALGGVRRHRARARGNGCRALRRHSISSRRALAHRTRRVVHGARSDALTPPRPRPGAQCDDEDDDDDNDARNVRRAAVDIVPLAPMGSVLVHDSTRESVQPNSWISCTRHAQLSRFENSTRASSDAAREPSSRRAVRSLRTRGSVFLVSREAANDRAGARAVVRGRRARGTIETDAERGEGSSRHRTSWRAMTSR